MDSLTQIVLGAAVGETVLGRKIGNRAMMWGAIGGTIPDLDVIANFTMTELDALVFHRGITHSIFFAAVGGLLFALLAHRMYAHGIYQRRWYKVMVTSVNILLLALLSLAVNRLTGSWIATVAATGIAGVLGWRLIKGYYLRQQETVSVSLMAWSKLFILTLLTHIALDSFTAFGTQLFQPFSDHRVAFNTIAVADPAYTLPFLIMVIITATIARSDRSRALVNWLGIGMSSLYLLVTVINKQQVDQTFARALENRDIIAERCRTSPTILNNILWNCVAEDQDAYYVGLYSMRDSDPNLHVLNRLPKNDSIQAYLSQFDAYHKLSWFSDDYLFPTMTDTAVILSDLRYGALSDTIRTDLDMVFSFVTKPDHDHFEVTQRRPRPENFAREFQKFTTRIMGY